MTLKLTVNILFEFLFSRKLRDEKPGVKRIKFPDTSTVPGTSKDLHDLMVFSLFDMFFWLSKTAKISICQIFQFFCS